MIAVGSRVSVPEPYEAWLDAGGGVVCVLVRCPDGRVLSARLTQAGAEAVALRLIEGDRARKETR